MSEKKQIDAFFKQLEHTQVTPPDLAWQNIEARLLAKKKKRRVVPFWWKLSGVAAILILGWVLIGPSFNGNSGSDDPVVTNNPVAGQQNQNSNNNQKENNPANQSTTATNEQTRMATADAATNNSRTNGQPNANGGQLLKVNPDEVIKSTVVAEKKQQVAVSPTQKSKKQGLGSRNSWIDERQDIVSNNIKRQEGTQKSGFNNSMASNGNKTKTAHSLQKNGLNEPANSITADKKTNPQGQQNAVAAQNGKMLPATAIGQDNQTNDTINNTNKNTTAVALNTTEKTEDLKKKDSANVAVAEPNALEELLKEKEEVKIAKGRKENRWQVTPNIAPIYFSSTANGSPLDEKLAENEKVYGTNYSYGLGINYAVNKKLNIRSGIHTFSTDYDTNNIVFYQNTNASRMQNVTPTLQGSVIQIDPLSNVTASFGKLVGDKFEGTLNQRMGYIEMPVEVSYRLVAKKFGLDLIGGFSTLYLTQNDVYLKASGFNMKIGEANNLNDIHFSTNIGLGLRYNLLKRFDLRVEPLFKYQLNTYSSGDGGFKPYIFGLYSGISYHF